MGKSGSNSQHQRDSQRHTDMFLCLNFLWQKIEICKKHINEIFIGEH